MVHPLFRYTVLSFLLGQAGWVYAQDAEDTEPHSADLGTVYVTAEQQLQQSLGASHLGSKDLDKQPPVNDISDLVRTMPGVNLTGNTATGQRGNKRQIDLRGMGPENTLILIDGKPVTSRNAERISMRGERNTRGDSNWVPVEAIDSIEVIRGPAAARYGSGAMGGVVNIITKKTTDQFTGSINYYTNQPQDSKEGATNRVGFVVSGPIVKDVLSFRVYGNWNKTDADSSDINAAAGNAAAAGVEGVRNKDIAARLDWKITPNQHLTLDTSFSRQGNIYNGDTQTSTAMGITQTLLADGVEETAKLYRSAFSLTHSGSWDWGDTKTWLSYDRTRNSRMTEGLTGKIEGAYTDTNFNQSVLDNLTAHTEANLPFTAAGEHVLTVGAEAGHSSLDDPASVTGFSGSQAVNSAASQSTWAVFAEDNWAVRPDTHLVPTLRFDHDSRFGANLSGGFNVSHQLGEHWLLKGGIARAYKAPNLYQSNPNFVLESNGNGCPLNSTTSCYLVGNADLKPEYSWNKELGLEFENNGWQWSATYFHNAYRNKITASDYSLGALNGYEVLQWTNTPKATVSGFEGNLVVPLTDRLKWSNNFTYMQKSEDYQGNPLSLVPKYTINSILSWDMNDHWDANLVYTRFGRIKPRSVATIRMESRSGLSTTEVPGYGLLDVNVGYHWNSKSSLRFGIGNVFNKKIYRTNDGALTFNQHGRSYYGSLKIGF